MFKSINTRFVAVITAAALAAATVVGGVAILANSVVPAARAETQVEGALHQAVAKGDRMAVLAKGTACSSRGWPHYEQSCQFDFRQSAGEMRKVRIIALR
jgi:hypothetical protein